MTHVGTKQGPAPARLLLMETAEQLSLESV
jgi:hypothetical protein